MKVEHPVRFGIIGGGLMGREFVSAAARWMHLKGSIPRPVITAVCSRTEESLAWFRQHTTASQFCLDYHELLANDEVDAVYCAVPHHLHAQVYGDVIRAGKHLLGEKPFGMDLIAYQQIKSAMEEHPEVFVRVASEFAFYPAVWQMIRIFREGQMGNIIEASFTMKHSSDMNLMKPINWKRVVATNGEYGCMGDLGIHTLHVPFRLGLKPDTVSAQLSNLAPQRLNEAGNWVECDTWDNAILLCAAHSSEGQRFPMRFEMKRMSPGSSNTVEFEILGMRQSLRFTMEDTNALYIYRSDSMPGWLRLPVGNDPAYPTITGGIFEFGFSDAILQMLAAFISELRGLPTPLACFTPDEALTSHQLLTAALHAHQQNAVVKLEDVV